MRATELGHVVCWNNRRMWPDYKIRGDLRKEGHAFIPNAKWPDLRVVIDPDLTSDPAIVDYFAFLRTRDSGVMVFTRGSDSLPSRVGDYYVVLPDATSGSADAGIRLRVEAGWASRAMFSAINNTISAYNWALAGGFDPDAARERQLDVEAASALKADIYITDNRFALAQRFNGGVFACSPSEAMAIVGLHQRLQGGLLIDTDVVPLSLDLSSAEYVASWGLLPNTLELFALEGSSQRESVRWKDLIRVAHVRLERCLRARDQILVRGIHPNHNFPFDSNDALVERVALNLSAMFDTLARAIKEALTLQLNEEKCSFMRPEFRRLLPESTKRLLGTRESIALLRTIGVLRNTIHHESLSHAAEGDSRGRVQENYVVLPASNAEEFRQHATTLGREPEWIAKNSDDWGVVIRAVPLIEDLIRQSVSLFETLVSEVEWPGTVNGELRVRADDPGEWWMYFTPTVSLVCTLYGMRPP